MRVPSKIYSEQHHFLPLVPGDSGVMAGSARQLRGLSKNSNAERQTKAPRRVALTKRCLVREITIDRFFEGYVASRCGYITPKAEVADTLSVKGVQRGV